MDALLLLLMIAVLLWSYLFYKWIQDPTNKIPGPKGLPFLGNVLQIDQDKMHMQMYDLARKYGSIFKLNLFTIPTVFVNTTDTALEVLIKNGTDFQGRPPTPRMSRIFPKEIIFSSIEDEHHGRLRRLFTKALNAYGPGVAHLEKTMQDTVTELIDDIHEKDGQPIDSYELSLGYVCCVIASLLFGEKYNYNDPICQSLHQMNDDVIEAIDSFSLGQILDLFPILFKFKFILSSSQKHVQETSRCGNKLFQDKLDEARKDFTKDQKRGILDYLIEVQQQEMNQEGGPSLSDAEIRGLLADFVVAGMETSFCSISQGFLDLLHNPSILKRIQAQIDEQFEPTHTITFKERQKLPLLEAFIHEGQRFVAFSPFLAPHFTIRDTELSGYKIPRHTRIVVNNFYLSHNPDVYEEPFTFKPDRFLDEEGNVVKPDHPARCNLMSFGSGRRACPGELLARSRIFLFFANILQKFDIESVGDLADNDVRGYKMRNLLTPSSTKIKFIRRQQ